jgi:hypothetical protein
MIDVIEKDVDGLDPLDAAALDQVPFGAVEDAGDEVERDQPLGRTALGVDCEGNAEPAKQLFRGALLGDQRIDGQIVEQAGQLGVSAPDCAVGLAHLVEEFTGSRGRLFGLGLDAYLLSSLRQSRPSWLLRNYSQLGALPLSYFQAS